MNGCGESKNEMGSSPGILEGSSLEIGLNNATFGISKTKNGEFKIDGTVGNSDQEGEIMIRGSGKFKLSGSFALSICLLLL